MKTICFAFLCCLFEHSVTSASFRFTSWPTTVCRYKDEPVTLTWLLSEPFSRSWFSVAVYYVKPVPVMVITAYGSRQPDDDDGVRIEQGVEFTDASLRLRHGSDVVSLTLTTVPPLHGLYGYQCVVRMTAAHTYYSREAWIVLCDAPAVPVVNSSAASPLTETAFTLTCSASSTTRASRHLPADRSITMTYTWLRDGRRLPTDGRHVVSGAGNGSLTIDPVQTGDHNRTYTCIARETASKLTNSNNITLAVRWPPHWNELHPDDRIAKAGVGGSCLFVVWITANPLPVPDRWRWKMLSGGVADRPGVQLLTYDDVAMLSINNVSSAHYGNYSIWTSNDYGGWNQSDLVFTLLPEDESLNTTASDGSIIPEPVKWYRLQPADTIHEVPLGGSAAFTVWIHGKPLPREDEWRWRFASDASPANGSSGSPEGVHLLVTGPVARLVIDNVTRSHYGTYSVWTRNQYGGWPEGDLKFTLRPEGRVLFDRSYPPGKTREVGEGESTSLVVWIRADPLPGGDQWRWNFSSPDSRGRRSADGDTGVEGLERRLADVYLTTAGDMAVLSILNVTADHYGRYFVWIDDKHGHERQAVVMFVLKSAGLSRDASVAKEDDFSPGSKAFVISAFLGFLNLVLFILLLLLVFRKKKVKRRNHRDYKEGVQESAADYSSNTTACPREVDNDVQYSVHRHLSISDGHFYEVWQGKLCKDEKDGDDYLQIAIKIAKKNNGIYTSYLQAQGSSLNQLRGNEYIVYCLGMVSDSLLLEYTPLGDLRQYLKAKGHQTRAESEPIAEMNLVLQIIQGIKAVQQLDPPALFYCLCSSNILVCGGTKCKLSGFAVAEAVRARERWEEENQLSRPIRWLAPEAIRLNHIAASDVWSFGVLMWEIYSPAGAIPLGDMTNEEAREQIFCGRRPLKPTECTPELYDVMAWCWLLEPRHRPPIRDIEDELMNITRSGPV